MKKVIIVTGGASGLGLEVVKVLSKDHTVYVFGKSQENLQNLSNLKNIKTELVDVTDFDLVDKAVKKVFDAEGKLDVLINSAGLWIQGELTDNAYSDIEKVFSANTLGTIFPTKAVLSYMKQAKRGTIINVISQAGLYSKSERSVYHSAKWAIDGFTKCLQAEVAKYGIRVTGLYPGLMNTSFFASSGFDRDLTNSVEVQHVVSSIEFILSLPEDVVIPELGIKNIEN